MTTSTGPDDIIRSLATDLADIFRGNEATTALDIKALENRGYGFFRMQLHAALVTARIYREPTFAEVEELMGWTKIGLRD